MSLRASLDRLKARKIAKQFTLVGLRPVTWTPESGQAAAERAAALVGKSSEEFDADTIRWLGERVTFVGYLRRGDHSYYKPDGTPTGDVLRSGDVLVHLWEFNAAAEQGAIQKE